MTRNIPLLKKCILVFCCCNGLFFTSLKAQGFIISSMGYMAGTSNIASPINFKSTATCIDVQTGIAVFNSSPAFGEFAINCKIGQVFNSLGLKLFPNPVTSNAILKFTNTPLLTQVYKLSIWDAQGELISTSKENGYSLFQGLPIHLNNLSAGTYILKLESTQSLDAIKFFKIN